MGKRIEHLVRVLRAIRNVNQLITREKDPHKLIQEVCDTLVETRGYFGAWLVLTDDQGRPLEYATNIGEHPLTPLKTSLKSGELPPCAQRALKENHIVVIKNPALECTGCTLYGELLELGGLCKNIEYGGRIWGVLAVTLLIEQINDEETSLFSDVTGDIAFALYNLETEEARRQADEALLKSEARLKEAQRLGKIGNWELDLVTQQMEWSDETYQLYERDKALGPLTPAEEAAYHTPEEAKRLQNLIMQATQGIAQPGYETTVLLPSGRTVFYSASMHPIKDETGKVTKLFGTLQDVTPQKEAERNLNYQALLVDNVFDAIVSTDMDHNVVSWNKAAESIFGWKEEEALGKSLVSLAPIEQNPDEFRNFQEQLIMYGHHEGDLVYKRRDGAILNLFATTSWYKDSNGKPIGHVAIFHDNTEQKKAKQELKQREEFLNSIIENSPNPLWISDAEGKVIRMNQALRDLLKVTDAEIIGKYNVLQDIQVKEQGYLNLVESVFKEGKTVNFTLYYYTAREKQVELAQKTFLVLDIVISAVKDHNGKIVNAICQHKDITAHEKARQALQKSEENFRNSLDRSPLGIRIITAQGETIYANQTFLDIYGYRNLNEFNAISTRERYSSASYEAHLERKARRAAGLFVPSRYEINIVRKDGEMRNLVVSRGEVAWNGEKQYQVVYQDITEGKMAEEENLRQRALLEAVNQVFQETFWGDTYQDVARTCLNVSQGLTGSELGWIGEINSAGLLDTIAFNMADPNARRNAGDQSTPQIHNMKVKGILGRIILDGQSVMTNNPAHNPDYIVLPEAHPKIHSFLGIPLKDGDKIIGIIALANKPAGYKLADQEAVEMLSVSLVEALIRKKAEEALLKSEQRLKQAQALGRIGSWEYDFTSQMVSWSDEMFDLYGRDKTAGPPTFDELIHYYPPEEGRKWCEIMNNIVETGNEVQRELITKLPGDKSFFSMNWIRPVKDNAGHVTGLFGIQQDITERKEKQKKELEVEALAISNKAKSELLANVSHELRTPLASIKGFIETLIEQDVKWSKKQQLDFLKSANMEADRLTFLIRDLLDMSRIDSGKMVLDKRSYRVEEILASITGVLSVIATKHKLKINIQSGLPPLQADKVRIGQVITNLVENATKFSPEGSPIVVEVKAKENALHFSVEDKGEGISPEALGNLFNRFYQAERVVSGKTRGTGLGLAICKGIVEAHSGKIWAESRPGIGSRFSFCLPI